MADMVDPGRWDSIPVNEKQLQKITLELFNPVLVCGQEPDNLFTLHERELHYLGPVIKPDTFVQLGKGRVTAGDGVPLRVVVVPERDYLPLFPDQVKYGVYTVDESELDKYVTLLESASAFVKETPRGAYIVASIVRGKLNLSVEGVTKEVEAALIATVRDFIGSSTPVGYEVTRLVIGGQNPTDPTSDPMVHTLFMRRLPETDGGAESPAKRTRNS